MNTVYMSAIYRNASVEAQKRGWLEDGGALVCVFCGERFIKERVYPIAAAGAEPELYTAEGAANRHVEAAHGGSLHALLIMGTELAGLSGAQLVVLKGLAAGNSDETIAAHLGDRAASTVRNHRRNLRLKAAEARSLVAIMELVEESLSDDRRQVDYGPAMTVSDDRIDITEAEATAIEAKYFTSDGALSRIPPKEKQKLVVLRRIADRFEHGREYSDAEVRSILGAVNEDYALLRRYLVDYRFMERDALGTRYRRT